MIMKTQIITVILNITFTIQHFTFELTLSPYFVRRVTQVLLDISAHYPWVCSFDIMLIFQNRKIRKDRAAVRIEISIFRSSVWHVIHQNDGITIYCASDNYNVMV